VSRRHLAAVTFELEYDAADATAARDVALAIARAVRTAAQDAIHAVAGHAGDSTAVDAAGTVVVNLPSHGVEVTDADLVDEEPKEVRPRSAPPLEVVARATSAANTLRKQSGLPALTAVPDRVARKLAPDEKPSAETPGQAGEAGEAGPTAVGGQPAATKAPARKAAARPRRQAAKPAPQDAPGDATSSPVDPAEPVAAKRAPRARKRAAAPTPSVGTETLNEK
jgi:hypothetical protein